MRAGALRRLWVVVLRCFVRGVGARRFVLVAAVAVAAVGAVVSLPAQAREEAGRRASAAGVKRPRLPRIGREIVALRTRSSKTFAGPGGARIARLWATPVHVRDRAGRWQAIDSRLRRAGGRFLNRANRYSVAMPADIGRGAVRVRRGRLWTQFSLRGARGPARVRGAQAWYENALPGVDVAYRALASSVKETLVLAGPAARRRFVFDLASSRGLRPRVLKGRGLVLRDRRGRTRLSFAAPWMVDARGRKSSRVSLALANVEGRWRLSMAPSRRWLDERRRAWPVTVDPYVYTEPDQDCELNELDPAGSYCAAGALGVGTSNHGGTTATHKHTAVLRFPALNAAIPRDVDVTWAAMKLVPRAAPASSLVLEARPLVQAWTGQASWNYADSDSRWVEPGGEPDPSGERAEEDAGLGPSSTIAAWPLRKMVRDWVAGRRANHGVLVTSPSGGFVEFYPADGNASTQGANEPRLEVEYTPRKGERRGWGFERMQLSDRISLAVNVASGNLLVRHSDFSMPGGLGPEIAVGRSYNSLNTASGRLGQGWTLDTGHDVRLENWGSAHIYDGPSGVRVSYEWDGTKVNTPAGFDTKMTQDANGDRLITDNRSQTKQRFNGAGQLLAVEDRNGRKITFDYASGGSSRVTAIKNHAGAAKATFAYDAGEKLDSFTDAAGRLYDYGYDANGKLSSYADPQNGSANPTRYEYNNACGKLSKITTPGGRITTIDYYPPADARECKVKSVTRVTNTSALTGPTWQFDYSLRRDSSGESEVTDPNGSATADAHDRIWRYTFDDQGRVTKARDALGRETGRRLSSTSNVQSYTAASNTGTTPNTSLTYDGDDNATTADTPVGAASIRSCADYGAADSAETRCDAPPAAYGGVSSTIQGSRWLPGRTTNPQGGRTNFTWSGGSDVNGNLYRVEQTDNAATTLTAGVSFAYGNDADDPDDTLPGRLTSISDHRNNQTLYDYDNEGNVDRITPPNPGSPNPTGPVDLVHTASLNRLARMIVANETSGIRQRRNLSYDALDRLTRIDYTGTDDTLDSGEPYVLYSYDRDGNPTAEETREQTTNTIRTRSMTYDNLNRITLESLPGGGSNAYTYDNVGNLRSLTDAGGKVEYVYNPVNEIRAVFEPASAKAVKFEHTPDGQRSKTTYPNGVTIENRYDGAFRPQEIWAKNALGATLQKFNYAYQDPATGRQTPMIFEKTDGVLGQTTRYAYDPLDRLTSATIKSSTGDWTTNTTLAAYRYWLDGVGNITRREVSGSMAPASVLDYAYNSANQLCDRQPGSNNPSNSTASCPSSGGSYTYDKNANQTTAPGRTAAYNLLDQTTNLTISGSPTSLVYLGAGQDRWITEGAGSLQHNVLGPGRRTAGTSSDYFTRDDTGTLVSRRNGSTRHYYLFDALGSVTGLTDSAGTVSQRHDYEPYGTPAPGATGQWGATTNAGDVATGQFGFAAGYRTVGGLYHYGQRYYDPADMRWTQPDPLDQSGDVREANRYAHVGGDPINAADPLGMQRYQPSRYPGGRSGGSWSPYSPSIPELRTGYTPYSVHITHGNYRIEVTRYGSPHILTRQQLVGGDRGAVSGKPGTTQVEKGFGKELLHQFTHWISDM